MKIISSNRKAEHLYHFQDKFEAGIVLEGTEVKSARDNRLNFKDSYVRIENGEAFLYNLHISQYPPAGNMNHDPDRKRKLLLNRKEINKLHGRSDQKGLTIVPVKVYFKGNRIKVEIALAAGKKTYDKRESIKKKDLAREAKRDFKNRY